MGEVIEANGLRMHATNLGAQPPFTYLVPEVMMLCASFMNVESGVTLLLYNGRGSNVKVLIEKKNQQAIVDKFLQEFDQSQIITSDITQSGVK